jgi:hypothetical protein
MSNYVDYECRVFHDDDLVVEVDLRSLPRKGEDIWFRRTDDDGRDAAYKAEIKNVLHVAETDEHFPYVELHVMHLREMEEFDEEEEEEEEDLPDPDCETCRISKVTMG